MNSLIEQIESWLTQLIDKRISEKFNVETIENQMEEIATSCIENYDYDYDSIIDDRLYNKGYADQDDIESVCKTVIKELDIRLHID